MSNEACREDFEVMKAAWLEFVHNEKEKEGTGTYLPNVKRCYCGKSRTSYPHWPPTTLKEAVAQLKCLIGEFKPHRMYLAHCWMTSLCIKLAAAEPRSKATIKQLISLVQEHCRITDRNVLETGHWDGEANIWWGVQPGVARGEMLLSLQLRMASPSPPDSIGVWFFSIMYITLICRDSWLSYGIFLFSLHDLTIDSRSHNLTVDEWDRICRPTIQSEPVQEEISSEDLLRRQWREGR